MSLKSFLAISIQVLLGPFTFNLIHQLIVSVSEFCNNSNNERRKIQHNKLRWKSVTMQMGESVM